METISLFESEIIVYADARAKWTELVPGLALFAGFSPGMTLADAEMKVGRPEARGHGRLGPWIEYKRPSARVVVAFEEHSSGAEVFRTLRLRAIPASGRFSEHFHPVIEAALQGQLRGKQELVIMHPDFRGPLVGARLNDGSVASITWFQQGNAHAGE